jgi:predicted CXXCH cytochrome family protein
VVLEQEVLFKDGLKKKENRERNLIMEVFGMDKVKWSLSLLLAFIIVGILSTAAFASDLYGLKAVQKDSGLEVSFNGNTNDSADAVGTQFDLVLKNGSTELKTYGPIALDSNKHGSYTIPSVDVKAGKTYKIQLYHTVDKSHVTLLSGVVIADADGSGLVNSNETGLNTTNKSRTGQNVHGFYQNNTNSCASCHQTHTANDNNLLLKDGTYSTCSACHDGTTGAFNNFKQKTATNASNSISGTFDVSADVDHGSMHQADGTLQISAAPGGNNTPDTAQGSIGAATWGQDFDCASCHAPHGGGSTDENNLNLDPMGWGGIPYATTNNDTKNGKLFKNATIYTLSTLPTDKTPYILVKATVGDVLTSLNVADVSKTNDHTAGYLYGRAGAVKTDKVLQTYRWDGQKYVPDFSLWLRSTGHVSAPFENANTFFNDATGKDITSTLNVVWRDGFIYGAGVDNVSTAQFSLGIDVETSGDNAAALYDVTNSSYVFDAGVEMTKYCGACHTDYMIDPTTRDFAVAPSLKNPDITRQVGLTDALTCVRCHFAHGTKESIMKTQNDQLATAGLETLSSANPEHSSALRRYINLDSMNFINSLSLSVSPVASPSTSLTTNSSTDTSTSTSSTTSSVTGTSTSPTTSSGTDTSTGSTTGSGTDTSTGSTTSSSTDTSTSSTTGSGTDTSASSITTGSGTSTSN